MTSDQASSDMRHMCVKEGFSYYAVIPERDVCGHQHSMAGFRFVQLCLHILPSSLL